MKNRCQYDCGVFLDIFSLVIIHLLTKLEMDYTEKISVFVTSVWTLLCSVHTVHTVTLFLSMADGRIYHKKTTICNTWENVVTFEIKEIWKVIKLFSPRSLGWKKTFILSLRISQLSHDVSVIFLRKINQMLSWSALV